MAPASSKEFLDIQATAECGFTLKLVRDMIKTYNQIDVRDDNNKRVYIDEHNEKCSRFKVGDRVRISKFKNIFAKGYTTNWSKEIFIVDKINDTVPYTYNLKDLNDEEIIGRFYDQELQKTKL